MKIRLDLIKPSPRPVRSSWDEEKMQELAQSIKEQGLIVPIKVRPDNGGYEIVYGHRRVEACRRAGLGEVEAWVEGIDDDQGRWEAIIENMQREDIPALDIAKACVERREAGYSDEEIAARVGWKNPDQVRHYVAMVNAPEPIRRILEDDVVLSERDFHATGPLHNDVETRAAVLEKASREKLSTRQVSRVAKAVKAAPTPQAKKKLLEWEYSSTLHDPEMVKERAQRLGAHDPLYRDDKPSPQREWDNTPDVKAMVEGVIEAARQWQKLLAEIRKMTAVDKLSPEAKQFMAHRVRQLAKLLNEWLEELERESDG